MLWVLCYSSFNGYKISKIHDNRFRKPFHNYFNNEIYFGFILKAKYCFKVYINKENKMKSVFSTESVTSSMLYTKRSNKADF